jgi:glycine reductase complex component B subunit alpha and beta
METAVFDVKDVHPSGSTQWDAGDLRLDLASLASVADREPGLRNLRSDVVRPGESVRLVNVLDAVEPMVKATDPDATFPGALGKLAVAGQGRTHRLEGVAVLATAELGQTGSPEGRDLQDAVIDLAGPAAPYCAWSSTVDVVLSFEFEPEVPLGDVDRSIRRATLRAARELASSTLEAEPDRVDTFEVGSSTGELPKICVILQLGSEGPLYDTYLYGASVDGMLPTLLDPREVLDGAITNGAYHWAALRNPTYFYQRNALIHALLDGHGERFDFVGVIAVRAYLMSAFEKERSAFLAAKLARQLGADGAILTTFAGGNSHTDTMLTCRACEQVGVRTVVIAAEMGGLTDHVPEADAIVSTGNAEELVDEWRPDRVIGGEVLLDGLPAVDTGTIPLRNYLGATSQMGDMHLKAVTW